MKHFKITLDKHPHKSRVECDGVLLSNVRAVSVHQSMDSLTQVVLVLNAESVEIEADTISHLENKPCSACKGGGWIGAISKCRACRGSGRRVERKP